MSSDASRRAEELHSEIASSSSLDPDKRNHPRNCRKTRRAPLHGVDRIRQTHRKLRQGPIRKNERRKNRFAGVAVGVAKCNRERNRFGNFGPREKSDIRTLALRLKCQFLFFGAAGFPAPSPERHRRCRRLRHDRQQQNENRKVNESSIASGRHKIFPPELELSVPTTQSVKQHKTPSSHNECRSYIITRAATSAAKNNHHHNHQDHKSTSLLEASGRASERANDSTHRTYRESRQAK